MINSLESNNNNKIMKSDLFHQWKTLILYIKFTENKIIKF